MNLNDDTPIEFPKQLTLLTRDDCAKLLELIERYRDFRGQCKDLYEMSQYNGDAKATIPAETVHNHLIAIGDRSGFHEPEGYDNLTEWLRETQTLLRFNMEMV